MNVVEKDLLSVKQGIIAHQCNLRGTAGGLAGHIFRTYPAAGRAYRNLLSSAEETGGLDDLFGAVQYVQVKPGLWIANVFGQIQPGTAGSRGTPKDSSQGRLEAFQIALKDLKAAGDRLRIPVHMPYNIGCSLGGGDWKVYSALIGRELPDAVLCRKDVF